MGNILRETSEIVISYIELKCYITFYPGLKHYNH